MPAPSWHFGLPPATAGSAHEALAFTHTFWWVAAFALLAVIPALLLPRRSV